VTLMIDSIEGKVTDGGSWIRTEVGTSIVDVIYSRAADLSKGSKLSLLHEYGGEARVAGRDVKAGVLLNVSTGSLYLVFIARDDNRPWRPSRTILGVERGRLVDTWRSLKPTGVREPLDGRKLTDTIKEVQRVARQQERPSEQR
jgi:hypothetical protein